MPTINRQPPQRYHGIFPTHPQVGGIRPRSNNRTRNRVDEFDPVAGGQCQAKEHRTNISHDLPVTRTRLVTGFGMFIDYQQYTLGADSFKCQGYGINTMSCQCFHFPCVGYVLNWCFF